MARREPKVIPIMVRIEPSLDEILKEIIAEEDDTNSTFMRSLLIRECERRGLLDTSRARQLMGA
jgi:hypothetical protein